MVIPNIGLCPYWGSQSKLTYQYVDVAFGQMWTSKADTTNQLASMSSIKWHIRLYYIYIYIFTDWNILIIVYFHQISKAKYFSMPSV